MKTAFLLLVSSVVAIPYEEYYASSLLRGRDEFEDPRKGQGLFGGLRGKSLCDKPCTEELQPHCGSDGNVYLNHCLFEIGQCKDSTLQLDGFGPNCTIDTDLECHKPCTLDLLPHCGSDGELYASLCMFEIAQCLDHTLTLDSLGEECTEERQNVFGGLFKKDRCNRPCTYEHFPHCASDGNVYGNKCGFEIAKCKDRSIKLVSVGIQCQQDPWEACKKLCTLELIPQCGSDGNVYPNKCVFEIGQCVNEKLELVEEGADCTEEVNCWDGIHCAAKSYN